MAAYGHQQVDRFAVLLDLWTNEVAYLENKRQVKNTMQSMSHVFLYRKIVVPFAVSLYDGPSLFSSI